MSYSNFFQPIKIPQHTFQKFLQFFTNYMLGVVCRDWNNTTFQLKESILEFHLKQLKYFAITHNGMICVTAIHTVTQYNPFY